MMINFIFCFEHPWKIYLILFRSDLVSQLTLVRDEKKKLRRLLREQEVLFQQQTGRRMQREDRIMAAASDVKDYSVVYTSYKQTKAKLRLLEALIAKQRSCN